MRLTVNLDEDLYQLAKSLALAENLSISVAVNKLLRSVTDRTPTSSDSNDAAPGAIVFKGPRRFPVVKGRPHRVISENDVERAEAAEDLRHLESARRSGGS